MLQTFLGVVFGGLITILVAIFIEILRKPKLKIAICESITNQYVNMQAGKAKFLLLEVENQRLPKIGRWMARNPASQVHGEIQFYDLDGQKIFENSMRLKWSKKLPVTGVSIQVGNQIVSALNPSSNYFSENIYPGEMLKFDIAAKFDTDDNCYGWTWENEMGKGWRNKDYEMLRKNYIVKVTLQTSGEKAHKLFRLINETSIDNFRLCEALIEDYNKVKFEKY